ncbi:MAG: hypothetical protein AB8C13_02035 [Phycisphaerales bacterium]
MFDQSHFTQALRSIDLSSIESDAGAEQLLAAIYDELRGIASGMRLNI